MSHQFFHHAFHLKMLAATTVVQHDVVAHCGLSGHHWHCKYEWYVGVCFVFLLPSAFSSFLFIPFILR